MKINILAFGIAKDIIKGNSIQFELEEGQNILALKTALSDTFPEFKKLKSLSIAVNESYQDDLYTLNESDEVVIIPPVSGG